jgi:hypothetical protein
MTDIRGYPNPLLQAFSDKYGLGVVFDANNVPTFNGNKVPLAEFKAFFETAGAGEDEGAAGEGGRGHYQTQ